MYTETSNQRRNDKARLVSPVYTDQKDMCVQFYYHMLGNGVGTLNVYAKVPGTDLGKQNHKMVERYIRFNPGLSVVLFHIV